MSPTRDTPATRRPSRPTAGLLRNDGPCPATPLALRTPSAWSDRTSVAPERDHPHIPRPAATSPPRHCATVHRMDIEALLREHGGCARTSELVRGAGGRSQLRALVGVGRVRRVRRGLYALPAADAAVVVARSLRGAPTCVSVAAQLGLPLL